MSEPASLFILKSEKTSLAQAETFLRNRQWKVASSVNLREALAYIIQNQPQFVMITADHPNKKVRILPKMLLQAFQVRIIGFAEKGTGASTKALQDMGLEYNLYPPVSGPAIERMVLKIRKDEETAAQQAEEDAKNPNFASSGSKSEAITLKGDSSSAVDTKASFEQARAALSQMLSSEAQSDADEGPGYIIQKGLGSNPIEGNYIPTGDGSGSSSANQQGTGPGMNYIPNQSGGAGGDSGIGYMPPSGSASTGGDTFPRGDDSDSDWGSAGGGSSGGSGKRDSGPLGGKSGRPESQQYDPSNPDTFKGYRPSHGPAGTKAGYMPSPSEEKENEGSNPAAGAQSKRKDSFDNLNPENKVDYVITRSEERYGSGKADSIIVKGTEDAIQNSVNLKDKEKANRIEKSSHTACINIKSPKFSGYLVCAMGKNRKIDKAFMNLVRTRLFGFLKSQGESVKDEDSMQLKLEEVDFTDWALEQAEFLRRSIHDGDEVAMAFFQNTEEDIKVEDSASEKMVKLDIKDLKSDVALEFDLYVFMPENNKYLLYTPKGKPFYGDQKERLGTKGVTHMHLRRESVHEVKKYRAQNFLNEKIAAYKALKNSGKKSS